MNRGVEQARCGLDGQGCFGGSNSSGVVALLVPGTAQVIETSSVLVTRWPVDDRPQEPSDRLMLARAAEGAVPVASQEGLPDIVAGVVGQVVLVLRSGQMWEVGDHVGGLAHERLGACPI